MLSAHLALLTAALFSGAAIYVNFVEQPARLGLGDSALLQQWKKSYPRGYAMQAPLAILGFAFGMWAWYEQHHAGYLIGALLMIANWPWTLLVIRPVNQRLTAFDASQAGPETRALIVRWNLLHGVRTALGCAAVLSVLIATSRK